MAMYPQTFLHDSGNDFHSSSPHFGQGFYGRTAELTQILEVTMKGGKNAGLIETVFVSGSGGCGKTHFVQNNLGSMLHKHSGWLTLAAKFERGEEYKSSDVVSAMFDKLVASIVEMRGWMSCESDIDYSRRVTTAISDAFDADSLAFLAGFIPGIQTLIPGTGKKSLGGAAHRQLVFLLSKLLCVVLSLDRSILMVVDDLQWYVK